MRCATECPYECTYPLKCVVMATVCISAVSMASAANTGKFAAPVSDSKELELRSTAISQKTKSKTFLGIKLWNEWASTRVQNALPAASDPVSPTTPLLQMPIQDLAFWLGKFVLEVRKQNG